MWIGVGSLGFRVEGLEVQSLGCTCVVLPDSYILQLLQGLFRDNGKEMQTTIIYWGNIGIIKRC